MATEKRLIFLDEAIAKIKDDGILGSGYSDDERIDDVIDMLESCHIIVDAVEVVRCKDCNFYEENTEAITRFCRRELGYMYAKPDGFCSYGERKDNG